MIDASVQHDYVSEREARMFLPFLLLPPPARLVLAGCRVRGRRRRARSRLARRARRIVGIALDPDQIAVARSSAQERGSSGWTMRSGTGALFTGSPSRCCGCTSC
jgi:hypothetical protein